MAVLNPLPRAVTVTLPEAMRRLQDPGAPRHVVQVDEDEPGAVCTGAWERRAGEAAFEGKGFRVAMKPGARVPWRFVVPSSDTYALFAAIPGGKAMTDSAAYEIVQPGPGRRSTVVDQRRCDGGWTELFTVALAQEETCEVVLTSGGTGATAADVLRAESSARYNDGGTVKSFRLDPLDGIVLLRRD